MIGSFEIIEELGRGGMGVVYRARDLRLERDVALKRPRRELLEQPGFRDRFISEARAASKVMHPNITTVFEVFEHEGMPWMVMEFVNGASLRALLEDRSPIPIETILEHAEGLCDALRVSHNEGILHRDIKPANVLIGGDGRARLTDFGLAKVWVDPNTEMPASHATTETGAAGRFAGTRGYMSPEQALGKTLDARSDLFSLGVVLYEMCAGRRAFPGGDSAEWLDALLHRQPPPIFEFNTDIPDEFQGIVRKAMEKKRFQRYQSANEMLLDIRAAKKWMSSDSGRSFGARFVGWAPVWRRIGLAAAAAAFIISIAWMISRPRLHPISAAEWSPRKLTRAPGWEAEPALSPDGSLVAFSSNAAGNPDIWLVDATGGNPLRLTDHPGSDRDPAWFPDGSAIAFVSDRSGRRAIWKVPVLGGDPMLVVPNGSDPAISPNGNSVAFALEDSSGLTRIGLARLEDPTRVAVISDDAQGVFHHTSPSWSPDGHSICFSGFRDLWLMSVEGESRGRRLTFDDGMDWDPVWSGDGRFIFFSSARDGTRAIWWVPASGGDAHRFTSGTGPEVSPSMNRRGNRLAYSTFAETLDLVVVDRETGTRRRMPGATFDSLPAISPDGAGIAFAVDSGDRYDLWFQPLSEDGPGIRRRLTDHPVTVAMPTFSPDGRWIAFFGVLDQQRDIWTVSAAGGVVERFTDSAAVDIQPAFSPDGKWLAFVSTRGASQPHVWIAPFAEGAAAGDALQVTRGDGTELFPAWSNDGRSLAYIKNVDGDAAVWVVGLNPVTPPRRITRGVDVRYLRWSENDDWLLLSGLWQDGRVDLRRVSLHDGRAEPLGVSVVFGDEESFGLFSVTNDRRFISYYEEVFQGDVWMLERR